MAEIRRAFGGRGCTLAHMITVANRLQLSARALRGEPADLRSLQKPAVLHWNLDHFVVMAASGPRGLVLHDPASGKRRVSWQEVSERFSGVVLELTPGFEFQRLKKPASLKLGDLWKSVRTTVRASVLWVFLLSLLLGVTYDVFIEHTTEQVHFDESPNLRVPRSW